VDRKDVSRNFGSRLVGQSTTGEEKEQEVKNRQGKRNHQGKLLNESPKKKKLKKEGKVKHLKEKMTLTKLGGRETRKTRYQKIQFTSSWGQGKSKLKVHSYYEWAGREGEERGNG